MEFFWGTVTGYRYCFTPEHADLPLLRLYGPFPVTEFWHQLTAAVMLVVAAILSIRMTKRGSHRLQYLAGALLSIVILTAALMLLENGRSFGSLAYLPSSYIIALGGYTAVFAIACTAFLVNSILRFFGRDKQSIRVLFILLIVGSSLDWSAFVIGLFACG